MSCIVSERGTPPSTQIFLVLFWHQKKLFYFPELIAFLASARLRETPKKSIGGKVFFSNSPDLYQVPC